MRQAIGYSFLIAVLAGCGQDAAVEADAPVTAAAPAASESTASAPATPVTAVAPVPIYEVDALWPKVPFPNNWLIQAVPVITTDHNDHIWAISRARDLTPDESMAMTDPPRGDCCFAAPEVLEFDMEGNLVNAWGGPGHHPLWPAGPQTVVVDSETNVWISARGRGDGLMKFSREGEFLWDFGHRGPRPEPGQELPPLVEDNTETELLPNGVFVFNLDEDEREIYILDYKRLLVYDMDTAEFKRGWGGRGMPLDEITNDAIPPYDWRAGPPPDLDQFAPALHCVHISVDDLVYVCERGNNRIQVFTKQGEPVFEFHVANHTPARGPECGRIGDPVHGRCGTTWNMTFSHDEQQQYVLVADGTNHRVWIHDRFTGEQVGEVGSPGRNAGQFYWFDRNALDSDGNMYTGEVWKGKRAQKFTLVNADGVSRVR